MTLMQHLVKSGSPSVEPPYISLSEKTCYVLCQCDKKYRFLLVTSKSYQKSKRKLSSMVVDAEGSTEKVYHDERHHFQFYLLHCLNNLLQVCLPSFALFDSCNVMGFKTCNSLQLLEYATRPKNDQVLCITPVLNWSCYF